MRRVAHISDLHFGQTDAAVVAGLLDDLNRSPPDLVIASGDFTMGARRSEYREARAFMDKLVSPWVGVPGNHDISPYHLAQRFFDPLRRYRRYIAEEPEPVWRDEELAVVCLNTARSWGLELNWAYGRIGQRQIARADETLAALPTNLFKIVVAHHPFLPPPNDPDSRLVGGAEDALAMFERRGVGLVLAGHLHRAYARFASPEAGGETDSARLLVAQAGSATSTRLREEPNAYNRIIVEHGVARVVSRVWTGEAFADTPELATAVPASA